MTARSNVLQSPRTKTSWGLPLFLTPKNKYPYAVLFGIFATVLYLVSNHYHWTEPKLLQMTWLDQMVPFVPETVWIYITEYFLFISAYVLSKDLKNANQFIYSFIGLQIASVIIFAVWPTTYPRDLFPLDPNTTDWLTYTFFSNLRETDTPANCCPSLHISSCYLSSFIFLGEKTWKKFIIFFGWATLIGITTLTTKQHYIVDIVGGLIMAILAYWIFHRYIPYRETTPA